MALGVSVTFRFRGGAQLRLACTIENATHVRGLNVHLTIIALGIDHLFMMMMVWG